MLRDAFIVLTFLAALPCSALTFTAPEFAGFDLRTFVTVSDGVVSAGDGQLNTDGARPVDVDMSVQETGTVGILDPVRVFSGYVHMSSPTFQIAPFVGFASGKSIGLRIDAMAIDFQANPIARIRTSLQTIEDTITASFMITGSVLYGSEEIPFTYIGAATDQIVRMTSSGYQGDKPSVTWNLITRRTPSLFTFQRDGLTYTTEMLASAFVFVPEPGTALLVGLGLAGLTRRRL